LLHREQIELIAIGRNLRQAALPSQQDAPALVVTPLHLPARHAHSAADSAETAIALRRRTLAQQILRSPNDADLARRYAADISPLVRAPAVRQAPADPTEIPLLDEILSGLARGPGDPAALRYQILAMLYFLCYELPEPVANEFDLPSLPGWLLDDYLAWALEIPMFFQEVGENLRYLKWKCAWIGYLHRWLPEDYATAPNGETWRRIGDAFLQRENFIPDYFNEQNLRELFSQRGDLLSRALRAHGFVLDHSFQPRDPNGPIRLGILQGHFEPSAETFASLPIYEHLRDAAPGKFHVRLYATFSRGGHPLEKYCRQRTDAFTVLPTDPAQQVTAFRMDDLDVLFVTTNVAAVSNAIVLLASHRLARAQVTSIFNIVTTGLPFMDCYISGTTTDPMPDAQNHYRERLLQMDGSVHCFAYGSEHDRATVTADRASIGLPPDAVVYASGANLFKTIPELVDAWAKILASVPNSVLMLFPFGPNWSNEYPKKAFGRYLGEICARKGVDAARVHLIDKQPPPDRDGIKAFLRCADVYLDSFPFCGSTSLMEPLEIGLPLVVKRGTVLRSSMAAAMLEELALPELIAADEAAYIKLAADMGLNPELRRATAERIRTAMARGPRFTNSRLYAERIAPILQQIAQAGH
jgi:hypothetical protein